MDTLEKLIKDYNKCYAESYNTINNLNTYGVDVKSIDLKLDKINALFSLFSKYYKGNKGKGDKDIKDDKGDKKEKDKDKGDNKGKKDKGDKKDNKKDKDNNKDMKDNYYEKLFVYYIIYRELTAILKQYFLAIARINFSDINMSGTSIAEFINSSRKRVTEYRYIASLVKTIIIPPATQSDNTKILKEYNKYNNKYASELITLLEVKDPEVINEIIDNVFGVNEITVVKKPWLFKLGVLETYTFIELCELLKIKAKNITDFIKLYRKPVLLFDKRYSKDNVIIYDAKTILHYNNPETITDGINTKIIERYKVMKTMENNSIGGVNLTKKIDDVLYIETDGFIYKYSYMKISDIDRQLNKFMHYNKCLDFSILEKHKSTISTSNDDIEMFYEKVLQQLNSDTSSKMTEKYKNSILGAVKLFVVHLKQNSTSLTGIVLSETELIILLSLYAENHIKKVRMYIIDKRINNLKDLLLVVKPFVYDFITSLDAFFAPSRAPHYRPQHI